MSEKTITLEQAIAEIKENLIEAKHLVEEDFEHGYSLVMNGQIIAYKDCLTILSKIKQ